MPDDDKGWPHSDVYEKTRPAENALPRTSLLKFGSWRDALASAGKLIGQSLIAAFLFAMLFIVLVQASSESDEYFLVASEIVKLICFTISVFLATRIFDDTNLREMGLRVNGLAFRDFLAGFGIIFAVLGAVFLLNLGTGAIYIQSIAWQSAPISGVLWNLLAVLVIFLFVGWSEELLSRGFHLRILSKGLNRPLGFLLSSAIFAYLHRNNPNMTTSDYIAIFLFGLAMSAAFLRSGNLWLPMGLHAGWDFFVVVFWGVPISGLRIFHLMDVAATSQFGLAVLPWELLELGLITILVFVYTLRRKPDIRDW